MLILLALALLFLSGVTFYGYFINKDVNPSELYTVEEPLKTSYLEKVETSYYKRVEITWQYVILLEDSDIKYEIDNVYLNAFDKDSFERAVAPGDIITIITEKEPWKSILKGPFHNIYSLQSGGKTYLSLEDTKENRKGNDKGVFEIIGFVSAGAAFILMFISIRKLISIQKRAIDMKNKKWDLPF